MARGRTKARVFVAYDAPPVAVTPARPTTLRSLAAAGAAHASAVPTASTAAPAQSPLADEIAAIDDAKTTLAGGAPVSALRKLDAYDSAFPHGTLGAEASALRIEALARSGRTEEARDALRRFRESHPASPLLESLARAVGG